MNNQIVGNGIDGHRLLRQAKEKLAAAFRSAPVEAEGELIQVCLRVRRLDAALVGSEQPALHERGDAVHGGE